MSEAVAIPLGDLLLEGKVFKSRISNRITSADISRTIEGASTLTIVLHDPEQVLLESKLLDKRVTTQIGEHSFELAQLRKSGDSLTAVFEDLAVGSMRRQKKARKVEAGVMTREQFAKTLVDEVRWLKFQGPKKPQDRTKVEMARGKTKEGGGEKGENTWEALQRLADEVNWVRFVVGKTVFFLPESDLIADPADYILKRGSPEVEKLDFDHDVGKPVGTVSATVHADKWTIPPGAPVQVPNLGPASGKYLVTEISGSLFSKDRQVTLRKPEPALAEPDAPSGAEDGYDDTSGVGGASVGGEGKDGWMWPTSGRVSQEFGGDHYGIDIAAPLGTAIVAAKAGTVVFAGSASGYGKAVYVDHGSGVICRYGHMSIIRCTRGERVEKGERIADVGHEGNSSGDHLHFEYRPGDVPRNPREIL